MTGGELLRLPNLPEGSPEEQLRAIRSYLYQLTEQLQVALSDTRSGTEQETRPESEELAQGLQARIGKNLEGRFIGADSWEAYSRREAERAAEALCRLAALEDRPESEHSPCPVEFRQGEELGIQRQEGTEVTFSPLEIPEFPLKKAPDGHWRLE